MKFAWYLESLEEVKCLKKQKEQKVAQVWGKWGKVHVLLERLFFRSKKSSNNVLLTPLSFNADSYWSLRNIPQHRRWEKEAQILVPRSKLAQIEDDFSAQERNISLTPHPTAYLFWASWRRGEAQTVKHESTINEHKQSTIFRNHRWFSIYSFYAGNASYQELVVSGRLNDRITGRI